MITRTTDPGAPVAAFGLRGSGLPLPEEPLPDDEWAALLHRVEDQRVPGFLIQAIDDGAFPATARQSSEAAAAHTVSMQVALLLERLLLRVVDAFEAGDVDYRVLKGTSFANLDYPNPSLRSFGDIDLLVPTTEYDAAVRAIGSIGARRRVPEIRRGFDRRFGKGGSYVMPDRLEVDLHRMFVPGPIGLSMRLDDLFATSTPFALGARPVLALDRELRFLHACFHAALGQVSPAPRLLSLRDVAQMLLHPALDSARVQQLCTDWQAEAVVARAVRWAWETFDVADVVPLSEWARGYEPNRHAQANLRVYGPGVRFSSQAAAAIPRVRGIGGKAAYLWALAFPERTYRSKAVRSIGRLLPARRRAAPEGRS